MSGRLRFSYQKILIGVSCLHVIETLHLFIFVVYFMNGSKCGLEDYLVSSKPLIKMLQTP